MPFAFLPVWRGTGDKDNRNDPSLHAARATRGWRCLGLWAGYSQDITPWVRLTSGVTGKHAPPAVEWAPEAGDLPLRFRTTDDVRDWLPGRREPMQKSRFTDEQMVGIIREADRDPVGEVAKRHGISEQTI